MITPLYLYTRDSRHFSSAARDNVEAVGAEVEPQVREHLPLLAEQLELACQTGSMVIPEIARQELGYTLFHELHHLARGWVIHRDETRTTFMEGVVSEGLATVFEHEVGGRRTPWGEYPDNVRGWVEELLALSIRLKRILTRFERCR
ncbi:DUF2268 domain-containing putative Zn-dependent protease [Vreelandella malpeensis]|uniref:DUF2268 domain-containing protein n=1 Tax=Vreelandella malpeensis TaxID=1172368 RepID=A0ABS8DN94_9GAMM|nr:DUF2268 domain-containing putative Zn-dependent protease [Halomonas malpeensis]MCB8887752.1 hypothetical protein [Halomonas malpeensis]